MDPMETNDIKRSDRAVERKHRLMCSCSQAVLLEFAPEIKKKWNVDEAFLLSLGSGFGSGMGGGDSTCGSLNGAGMVLGLLDYAPREERPQGSVPTIIKSRKMCAEFKEKAGALRCADLKGIETKKVLCTCDNCVRYAVQLVEKYLEK